MVRIAALEESTFQNRPAYKYIRVSDRLPTYAETLNVPFSRLMAPVKLFSGGWTWYVAAYDPDTRTAWGVADGFEREVGSFSMVELVALRGQFGLPVERDLYWRPESIASLLHIEDDGEPEELGTADYVPPLVAPGRLAL